MKNTRECSKGDLLSGSLEQAYEHFHSISSTPTLNEKWKKESEKHTFGWISIGSDLPAGGEFFFVIFKNKLLSFRL